VRLSDAEQALLAGASGHAARKAMQILVALGGIFGADRLVGVRSVQIAGVSYHNLGEAGLEWLEDMAKDGRVRTLATLNPAGMDLRAWERQGIPSSFAKRQLRLIAAYTAMGVSQSCTCTPYLTGNLPAPGEHVAWAESSAVAYANSVLGARTNREGGPSALAAALTGRTPRYGLHLDENRIPTCEVVVRAELRSSVDWGTLGYLVGRLGHGRVVVLRGAGPPELAHLKSFGAAVVTFGGSPLFAIEGVTPSPPGPARIEHRIAVTESMLREAIGELDDGGDHVDMVCLGCPHASLSELLDLAEMLDGQRVRAPLWVCTARATAEAAQQLGIVDRIEASGAQVVADTCYAVAPLDRRGATIATDSVKGCYYGRGHNQLKTHLGCVQRCVRAALTGRWQ
jgi:predicted aconitase